MEKDSGVAVKPTFVTIGPLRIKRRYFAGYIDEDNALKIYLNFEEGGVWTERIKDNKVIENFKEDIKELEEQAYL